MLHYYIAIKHSVMCQVVNFKTDIVTLAIIGHSSNLER